MDIKTRDEWGALAWRTPLPLVPLADRRYFVVHYHGGAVGYQRGNAVPKNVEVIHRNNGWRGVGYNFMIDMDGVIYEGAGWDGRGSHSPPRNTDGLGVYLAIGGSQKPTQAALDALQWLKTEADKRTKRKLTWTWHGEDYATECPGSYMIKWVKKIRAGKTPAKGTKPSQEKPSWDGKSFPGVGAFQIGQSHPAVTLLGQRLVKHGFGKRYKVGPGATFTEVDRLSVQDFQLAQGYKGTQKGGGADGFPGPKTWAALMKEPKKKAAPKPKPKAPAFPSGIGPNKSKPSAITLQKQLQKAGFMPKSVKTDANYGPRTQNAVAAFHKKHPQFRTVGKSYDPAIGPKGWAFLFANY